MEMPNTVARSPKTTVSDRTSEPTNPEPRRSPRHGIEADPEVRHFGRH